MREHPDHPQQGFRSDGHSIEIEDASYTAHNNLVVTWLRGAHLRKSLHRQLTNEVISRGTLKLTTATRGAAFEWDRRTCGSSKIGSETHAIKAFI
jgi:hypothetical protein